MVSITVRTKFEHRRGVGRRNDLFLAITAAITFNMFNAAEAAFPLLMREHDYVRGPTRTHHKEISTYAYTDSLFGAAMSKNLFRFKKKDMENLRLSLQIPDMISVKKQFKCTGAFALRVFLYRLARAGTWPASAHVLCGRHPAQLSRIFHHVLTHIHTKFGHLVSDVGRWCDCSTLRAPRARPSACAGLLRRPRPTLIPAPSIPPTHPCTSLTRGQGVARP